MEEKIINISNVIYENKDLYGDAAREKIIVDIETPKGKEKRTEYLDENRTIIDINNFLNQSNNKKMNIHVNSLNKTWKNRLLWNLIMLLIGSGAFFLIPGIGNLVTSSFSINASVVSTLGYYLLTAIELGLFTYVNQKKFYYNNNELKNLEKVKKDIEKAEHILLEIEKYKEREIDSSRIRDNIDYRDTIRKNHNRNVDMFYERERYKKESRERIDKGVEEIVKKKTPLKNINFNDEYENPNVIINRKSNYKKMEKSLGEILEEERMMRR